MSKKKELKIYSEAELIIHFGLNRIYRKTKLLENWLKHKQTKLNEFETITFKKIIQRAQEAIDYWSEEDLKMYFITHIVELSNLMPTKEIGAFFDKKMEAEVDNYKINCRPDFTMAKSVMDLVKSPYFHFHEYKKEKVISRDPLGQLLKAFLIGSVINNNAKPLYGAYIVGRFWYFVVYENNSTRDYCVSKAYDSTQEDDLMQIIAILRQFKVILETVLLVD